MQSFNNSTKTEYRFFVSAWNTKPWSNRMDSEFGETEVPLSTANQADE